MKESSSKHKRLTEDGIGWAMRLNARSALARGVSFALGFSFFVNMQLIGGQMKALDEQNMYSELYSVYS